MQDIIEKEIIKKVKAMNVQDKIKTFNLLNLTQIGNEHKNLDKKKELLKLAGSWKDIRTAHKIISEIQKSRKSTQRSENIF